MKSFSLFVNITRCSAITLFFFYKNVVLPAQAEYSYFSADFRLNIYDGNESTRFCFNYVKGNQV